MKKTFKEMKLFGLSREAEEAKLEEIIDVTRENLDRTKRFVASLKEDLKDLQENYDYEDKETLVLWNTAEAQLKETERDLLRYERARKKPYFGRIDFRDEKLKQEESYYIGRVAVAKNTSEPMVIDWRAPIASTYYENTIGPCTYEVRNEGAYSIELLCKRTYEIKDDQLIDFFDSDVVANDELLTKYLAKSKKAVLGEIIATIQQEQNAIIRKSPKTNLIVQGVAGSGKTTVAMHRISYILYNYEKEFQPKDFYIIGSNKILLNYITSVLPDLDVYGVSQMTMEQLFVRLLYEDWDKNTMKIRALDKKDELKCIKGSQEWFQELSQFCEEYEKNYFSKNDVVMESTGAVLMGRKLIDSYLANNPLLSMQTKINNLNEFLLAALETEIQGKNYSFSKNVRKELERKYGTYFGRPEFKGSIVELYKQFLEKQIHNGKSVLIPEDEYDLYDLAGLAYLYKRIKEVDGIREASHVVIDEAQDFGMMAYQVLHYCLRDCTYTIMGDVSQNIHFGYGLNDWEALKKLILSGPFDSFELLRKSYRNTVEISNYATEILRHGNFSIYPVEPIIRHGSEVRQLLCKDEKERMEKTIEVIENWKQDGMETIAVICRNQEEAEEVRKEISRKIEVVDSSLETAEFTNGVMVLPVEFTKGLEFDTVILYHPTKEHYPAEDGYVKLLYVACTRALHELVVIHEENLTEIIGISVSEEKRMQSLNFDTGTRVKRFENKAPTIKQQQKQDVLDMDKERSRRGYIGPKHIRVDDLVKKPEEKKVIKPLEVRETKPTEKKVTPTQKKTITKRVSVPVKEENQQMNPSPYTFFEMPDNAVLTPKGHSRSDNGIRWVKKEKDFIDLTSNHGVLRITPISEECVRIQFRKGQIGEFEKGLFDPPAQKSGNFQIREERTRVVVATEKLQVIVEKKTGNVQFFDAKNQLLLQEKEAEPRQLEQTGRYMNWIYFDWKKKEKIMAKGMIKDDLRPVSGKANYISHGKKAIRMPVIRSSAGYELHIAAGSTVLFCNIPVYGNYIYTEDMSQIDYYFTLYNEEPHK